MRRKARISNPTFKPSSQYMQQERRNRPPLFYYPSLCPSEAAGALSSRSMASSMARLIKPFTLSLWASAWALMISFLPFGIATDTRSRFAASHFCALFFCASVYFLSAMADTSFPFLLYSNPSYLTSRYLHKNLLVKLSNIPS